MENIKSKQLILHEGQILFDVYKIIKQINTGGMNSVIYLAQGIDDKDNKPQLYTVKVINRTDETTDEG